MSSSYYLYLSIVYFICTSLLIYFAISAKSLLSYDTLERIFTLTRSHVLNIAPSYDDWSLIQSKSVFSLFQKGTGAWSDIKQSIFTPTKTHSLFVLFQVIAALAIRSQGPEFSKTV